MFWEITSLTMLISINNKKKLSWEWPMFFNKNLLHFLVWWNVFGGLGFGEGKAKSNLVKSLSGSLILNYSSFPQISGWFSAYAHSSVNNITYNVSWTMLFRDFQEHDWVIIFLKHVLKGTKWTDGLKWLKLFKRKTF